MRTERLREGVAELPWYHTLQLPDGVVTPGFFDTVAGIRRVPFPGSLAGKRCLDIATANGFWAFEMERRGAQEVVALDIPNAQELDWPGVAPPADADHTAYGRAGFDLAHKALDSNVERVDLSVYDITPERLGRFDFVFIGNVLIHLRDPIGALRAARSVVSGELLSVDAVSLVATVRGPRRAMATLSTREWPWWWTPNRVGYDLYFRRAGYEVVDRGGPFFFPFGTGYRERPKLRRVLRSVPQLWFWIAQRRLGSPSAWVQARPVIQPALEAVREDTTSDPAVVEA